MNHPFIRNIEVLIGPLPEWQGGGKKEKAIRILADGSNETLRIKFSIRAHIISTASPTIVTIYNLGPGIRNSLQQAGAQIIIRAGWGNTGMLNVFQGSILSAVHMREGADIVTILSSLSGGGGLNRAIVSHSVKGGATLSSIVKSVASKIPGVTVSSKLIQVPNVKIGNQGLSLSGSASDVLNKLARVYGFNWWIDKGVFKALSDLKGLAGSIVNVSSANGFLIRAEPILASPMQIQSGVAIVSLFNPLIEAGGVIKLDSKLNPKLSGSYLVHSLSHSGDSHSSSWTTATETWWGYQ